VELFSGARLLAVAGGALASLLLAAPAGAAVLEQLNLPALVTRADSIVRAELIRATPDEIELGGGRLPVVRYEFEVLEVLERGNLDISVKGGRRVAQVTMLAPRTLTGAPGGSVRLSGFGDMPALRTGGMYALFVTAPSTAGLSAPVGLAQGAFQLTPTSESGWSAVNGFDNTGLLNGMPALDLPRNAPIAWADLRRMTLEILAATSVPQEGK